MNMNVNSVVELDMAILILCVSLKVNF